MAADRGTRAILAALFANLGLAVAAADLVSAVNQVGDSIRAAVPIASPMYVEPDIASDS